MRRHYIDNLRWLAVLLLIPYHGAMAWNVWGEPYYLTFPGSKALSAVVVSLSPYFMPLLFVLAGISARLALEKYSGKEFIARRLKRLLVPFLFGVLGLMPVMSYLAHRFRGYDGGFLSHYAVFFTKFTDLTGADGGFSLGQFWFVLYLLLISVAAGAALPPLLKKRPIPEKAVPLWLVLALGLPLPLWDQLLSFGGKSLAANAYLYLLGFFVLSREETVSKLARCRWPLLGVGLTAAALQVYSFLWAENDVLALIGKYIAQWVMVLALLGLARKYLDFSGKRCGYFAARSYCFYIYHFVWVVALLYLLSGWGLPAAAVYVGTVLLSYGLTFACCEISLRVPLLRVLTGTSSKKSQEKSRKN